MTAQERSPASQEHAAGLLRVIQDLAADLHPNRTPRVNLESSLDRDLGFDSLARMELLNRLEKHFGITLAEQVLAEAETPRDLLRALAGADAVPTFDAGRRIAASGAESTEEFPREARTLTEALAWHLEQHPERPQTRFYADEGEGEVLSYRRLAQGARAIAAGLQERGLPQGTAVAIMLPTSAAYLCSFWGVLLAGGVPVPLYPPVRRAQLESHLRRQQAILDNCGAFTLITLPEALPFARLLKARLPTLKSLVTAEELAASGATPRVPTIGPEDTAFLQYTSGSTGTPKGVVLSHANLLANIRALGKAVAVRPSDVIVSWLPLYHDMGLIGTCLAGLYFGTPVVLLSPLDFLSRPRRWLWALHRYGGTLSPAPNFAYEICLTKVGDEELTGLDLSSWRGAFNGAEPVSAATLERFAARFAPHGLRPEALMPVYGLAECTVGLAFPPLGRPPLIERVSRETLARTGRAEPAADDPTALRLVACGRPLDGHEIRIVDAAGRELPERTQGRVQFRGPSACGGYFRNPEETRRLRDGDWYNTGDLGYLAGGDLFLTGRAKDLIIIGGRNLHPQELEEAVGALPGIRKGNVVVFGRPDPATGSERLVVVAETRETDAQARERLSREIQGLAVDLLGTPPDELLLVPPHSILKTSSGKIRRAACRELHEQGRLGKSEANWRPLLRLALASLGDRCRQAARTTAGLAYAGFLWGLFGLAAALGTLAILLLPRAAWRLRALHHLARIALRLSGLPLRVEGVEHLPPSGNCVLVANHASYLDPYLLAAALPIPLNFVAKAELQQRPVLRFLLRRIGTEFVDRFDARRGAEDARRFGALARAGRNLVFFAEGTFTRAPGLRPFRLGAFVTAAAGETPLIPIAISGSRSVLRDGSWFPRRGALRVQVLEALNAKTERGAADTWSQALDLRRRARRAILEHCGEPDLDEEKEQREREERI